MSHTGADLLGATPLQTRALAPDLARGGMLLLIALANVHLWTYGHPLGVRGYPRDLAGVDRGVAFVSLLLVDGRAYPLFGLLFGYGITQLARRRAEAGVPAEAVTPLVRRRGWWMLAIGAVHGLLLWSGDIVGAYGLLAVLFAGLLVRGSDGALAGTAAGGLVVGTAVYAAAALPLPGERTALLRSMTVADPVGAAVARSVEWLVTGFLWQAAAVFAMVALGAWAGRARLLDEPERHRRLLVRGAAVGLAAAVLSALPLALAAVGTWDAPSRTLLLVAGALHTAGGYAGGIGYAALFGLLALHVPEPAGPVAGALQACGQRSLSCYLAQSVAFAALLPAWSLGLGDGARLWQASLVGVGTWLVILVVAALSARAGLRGPGELLLRRATYGRPTRE
jgi:uncharacterized membrane protein YeiB